MSDKNTVGSYTVKALLILVAFNLLYTLIKMIIDYINSYVVSIVNTFGTGWVFSPVVEFLLGLWGWYRLLLLDVTAVAIIMFISMVEEAYSTKWRR